MLQFVSLINDTNNFFKWQNNNLILQQILQFVCSMMAMKVLLAIMQVLGLYQYLGHSWFNLFTETNAHRVKSSERSLADAAKDVRIESPREDEEGQNQISVYKGSNWQRYRVVKVDLKFPWDFSRNLIFQIGNKLYWINIRLQQCL